MFKIAIPQLLTKIKSYWRAFTLRLSYGHSTLTAARLAYLEVK